MSEEVSPNQDPTDTESSSREYDFISLGFCVQYVPHINSERLIITGLCDGPLWIVTIVTFLANQRQKLHFVTTIYLLCHTS